MEDKKDIKPRRGFNWYKRVVVICLIPVLLFVCVFILIKENEKQNKYNEDYNNALIHNNYLLNQMVSVNKKYAITERNSEEIALQNYSLGRVDVYDKYGTEVAGFLINDQLVYYNWYSIEENANGIFDINMKTVDRSEEQNRTFNGQPWIIHDRALSINLSPYSNLSFASLNGNDEYKNSAFATENSSQIKYDVKTKVTEFATTLITDRSEVYWNSSHTDYYRIYYISYIKITFEDITYKKANICEYKFSVTCWSPENYDYLFENGEYPSN